MVFKMKLTTRSQLLVRATNEKERDSYWAPYTCSKTEIHFFTWLNIPAWAMKYWFSKPKFNYLKGKKLGYTCMLTFSFSRIAQNYTQVITGVLPMVKKLRLRLRLGRGRVKLSQCDSAKSRHTFLKQKKKKKKKVKKVFFFF